MASITCCIDTPALLATLFSVRARVRAGISVCEAAPEMVFTASVSSSGCNPNCVAMATKSSYNFSSCGAFAPACSASSFKLAVIVPAVSVIPAVDPAMASTVMFTFLPDSCSSSFDARWINVFSTFCCNFPTIASILPVIKSELVINSFKPVPASEKIPF